MKKILFVVCIAIFSMGLCSANDVLIIDRNQTVISEEKMNEILPCVEEYLRYLNLHADDSDAELQLLLENFYAVEKTITINTKYNELLIEWEDGEHFVSFSRCEDLVHEVMPIVLRTEFPPLS